MDIQILHYAEGAAAARGLAVVIDVFRAFSAACYAFDRGAEKIIATSSIAYALDYRRRHPDAILMGERHAKKLEGFDYGNSPSEILDADLASRTLVHTTHAGTAALVAATRADDAITGSFVNAGAIVRYIRSTSPDIVSLVCAGFEGEREAAEDILCAEYIKGVLAGTPPTLHHIKEQLMDAPSARRFFDPTDPASPEIDFHLCLKLNRFNFVIRRGAFTDKACELMRVDDLKFY